jgi:hypothetical protein
MERERVREPMSSPPTSEYVREKAERGWNLVAVEWERTADAEIQDAGEIKEEIPYGLRVAPDCRHLEEASEEKEALALMLEMIVEDRSLSEAASAVNSQGLRTRDGQEWTQSDVFYMLPRLIEVAPRIFASETWKQRRVEVTERLAALMS